MVTHKVFGVERDIDIPADTFPTDDELKALECTMPGCEHGWFDSVVDAAKLHYRKWVPSQQTKPAAIIIFMHGISTHAGKAFVLKDGRKINLALQAEAALQEGYATYAYDLYGHGFSEGKRFYIPECWENNLKDYVNFIHLVASKHDDDIPIFLMGESYGCTLTIHAAKQFQDNPSSGPKNFDSIILTAPAIIGDLPPYPVYFLLRYVLAPRYPKWRPFFMPNPISADRIWRDPEVLALRTDERFVEMGIDGSGIPFRLGTALSLVLALDDVRSKAIPGFNVPYCILHGTDDYGVPITGSEYMWKTAATPEADREFHKIDGAYHDLFADPEAEKCMGLVVDWVKKRLSKK